MIERKRGVVWGFTVYVFCGCGAEIFSEKRREHARREREREKERGGLGERGNTHIMVDKGA